MRFKEVTECPFASIQDSNPCLSANYCEDLVTQATATSMARVLPPFKGGVRLTMHKLSSLLRRQQEFLTKLVNRLPQKGFNHRKDFLLSGA